MPSNNLRWNDVNANFGDASRFMGAAVSGISEAGNIFQKMSQMRAEEQKRAEDIAYREKVFTENQRIANQNYDLDVNKFNEATRQFGITSAETNRANLADELYNTKKLNWQIEDDKADNAREDKKAESEINVRDFTLAQAKKQADLLDKQRLNADNFVSANPDVNALTKRILDERTAAMVQPDQNELDRLISIRDRQIGYYDNAIPENRSIYEPSIKKAQENIDNYINSFKIKDPTAREMVDYIRNQERVLGLPVDSLVSRYPDLVTKAGVETSNALEDIDYRKGLDRSKLFQVDGGSSSSGGSKGGSSKGSGGGTSTHAPYYDDLSNGGKRIHDTAVDMLYKEYGGKIPKRVISDVLQSHLDSEYINTDDFNDYISNYTGIGWGTVGNFFGSGKGNINVLPPDLVGTLNGMAVDNNIELPPKVSTNYKPNMGFSYGPSASGIATGVGIAAIPSAFMGFRQAISNSGMARVLGNGVPASVASDSARLGLGRMVGGAGIGLALGEGVNRVMGYEPDPTIRGQLPNSTTQPGFAPPTTTDWTIDTASQNYRNQPGYKSDDGPDPLTRMFNEAARPNIMAELELQEDSMLVNLLSNIEDTASKYLGNVEKFISDTMDNIQKPLSDNLDDYRKYSSRWDEPIVKSRLNKQVTEAKKALVKAKRDGDQAAIESLSAFVNKYGK